MNYSNYRVSLDIRDTGSQALLKFNKNDTAKNIVFVLTEGGKPYKLTSDCSCFLSVIKPDGTTLVNNCTIDASTGTILYDVTAQTTACVGTFDCQLTVTGSRGAEGAEAPVLFAPIFSMQVKEVVISSINLASTSEFSALVEMINDVKEYEGRLQSLENNAENFSEVMASYNKGELKGETGEKGEKGDTGDPSDLNIRNGGKKGSLVQLPFDTAETPKEPTRDYQTLLGENPPANVDDLFEVDRVFAVREDGTVYAKGEPKNPEDLIRRRDAPPLIDPPEKGNTARVYGVLAISDDYPNGKQTAFEMSPSAVRQGVIPSRTTNGDILVPLTPSADNAAASKAFVNSSVATATSTFRGTFDMTETEFKNLGWQTTASSAKYYVEKNDYAFLYRNSTDGTTVYTRYKWNGTSWGKEYQLNNSGFTAAQWSAINSGISETTLADLRGSIGTSSAALQALIDAEKNRATDAESGLSARITSNATALNNKVNKLNVPTSGTLFYIANSTGDSYVKGSTGNEGKFGVVMRTDNGQIAAPNQLTYAPSDDQLIAKRFADNRYALKGTGGGGAIHIHYAVRASGYGDGWKFNGSFLIPSPTNDDGRYIDVTTRPFDVGADLYPYSVSFRIGIGSVSESSYGSNGIVLTKIFAFTFSDPSLSNAHEELKVDLTSSNSTAFTGDDAPGLLAQRIDDHTTWEDVIIAYYAEWV